MSNGNPETLAIWNEMAAGWRKFNDYLWDAARPLGEWLVGHVDPQPGQTILDIAAGPGDTGFVAAKLVGDEGRLICTDFAPEMVAVARDRAAELGVTNAEFRQMNAEDMDLPDDHVDGVVCKWGYMLMDDPGAALRETRRVLKDGGRLAFATWAGPERNEWVTVVGMTMIQEGFTPKGDPFGPGGIFSLATEERVTPLVTAAGFATVEFEEVPVVWRYENFDQLWDYMSQVAGALAALLKTLDEQQIAQVRAALERNVEGFKSGDGYVLPGVSLAAVAQ